MSTERTEMSILFDLWLINHLLSGALDEVLVDASGLTGEDFGFYSLLRRFGPLTPTQISRWTAMPATTVSATVRRLAARGHVEHTRNPADGRSRLIALTEVGMATHAATASVFFEQTRPLAVALGPDEFAQRLSLQRLDTALREVGGLDRRPYAVVATSESADVGTADTGVAATKVVADEAVVTEVVPGSSARPAVPAQLSYLGPTLRSDEQDSVRSYIDFIRSQRK